METDDFPHWAKGTVWIEISQGSNRHYQLHKAVLERNSTWFAAELEKTIVEPGIARKSHLKDAIRYVFRLESVGDEREPVLLRVVSSRYKKQRRPVTYFACSRLTWRTPWSRRSNSNHSG